MQLWTTIVLALQMLAAIGMIGLVLIQHGKGADMGASFGSGASGSLFGATGSSNALSKATAGCATVFFVSTLALAFMTNAVPGGASAGGRSILERAAPAASAAASGAAALPAATASAVANAASGVPAIPTK
jgi:preprotein translocase subunit SecG